MKRTLMVLLLMVISNLVLAQEMRPVLQDETAQTAWREDVDYLIKQIIDIHPDPFFRFPEAEFTAAAARLKADIPFMSDNQIIAELARIAAMLDGHSYLFMLQPQAGFHVYPIRLYQFDDGVYVVNAAPEYRDLIGARLVTVNGIHTQAVFDLLSPYTSGDNLYILREWGTLLMIMPELLQAVGVTESLDQPNYEFVDAAGEAHVINFEPITLDDYLSWNEGGMYEVIGLPQQESLLYLSHKGENFWHTILEDSQTLYVQYNQTFWTTSSGMTISDLADAIETASAEGKAERLILDVRLNLGGDNTTYGTLLRAVRNSDFNQPGRLFVLIGRETFSAGKDFAMDVAMDTEAVLIGQPTGGSPDNYDNPRHISLPNSGLDVVIAARYVPRSREGEVFGHWLAPELTIPLSAVDYFAGRDPVLEAALDYTPAP